MHLNWKLESIAVAIIYWTASKPQHQSTRWVTTSGVNKEHARTTTTDNRKAVLPQGNCTMQQLYVAV